MNRATLLALTSLPFAVRSAFAPATLAFASLSIAVRSAIPPAPPAPPAFAPAPDARYEEIVSLRQPLSGNFEVVPSNWAPLACTSFPPQGATSASAAVSSFGVLFICFTPTGVVLFDATAGVTHTLPILDAIVAGSTIVASPAAPFAILLSPGANVVYAFDCVSSQTACTVSQLPIAASLPEPVHSATMYANASDSDVWRVWVTGEGADTVVFDINSARNATRLVAGPFGWGGMAVAHSSVLNEVSIGNSTKIAHFSKSSPGVIKRWEWVTDVETGEGGAYDGPITSLAYDDVSGGTLYAGTPTCLNVRNPGGAVFRVSELEGLPWGNITSLAIDATTSGAPGWTKPRVWIGSNMGVTLYDPEAPSQYGRIRGDLSNNNHGAVGAPDAPLRQRFRYFYGSRYLATTAKDTLTSVVLAGGIVSAGTSTYVLTTMGLSMLQSQQWTLAEKVKVYEAAIPHQSRLGQVTGCSLSQFGVSYPCVSG